MKISHPALPLAIAALLLSSVAMAEGKKAALFDVTFIDTSTEGAYGGVREDEVERIGKFNAQLRVGFEDKGYELLALDPVTEVLDRTVNPAKCNNCEIRMGETLGADVTVTAEVQKVSNLILSMNVVMREVETGRQIRGGAVDIRGNNDRSWERGLSYLLRNRIFSKNQ